MLWILVPVGYAGEYFNVNEQGTAIDGFDPVAYFELKKRFAEVTPIKRVGRV